MSESGGDAGMSSTPGTFDGGVEASVESGFESAETTDSELFTDKSYQELYDPGYDHSEFETELLDFHYDFFERGDPDDKSYESYKPDTEIHYNKDGEPVDVEIITDEEFRIDEVDYLETGRWKIDWDTRAKNAREHGFDASEPVTDEVLMPGLIIARYGSEFGQNGTDKGTEHSKLSLPYDPKSQEYHEYRVISPVSCKKGIVAENFGKEGKGTQYYFLKSFVEMSDPKNPNRTLEKIK